MRPVARVDGAERHGAQLWLSRADRTDEGRCRERWARESRDDAPHRFFLLAAAASRSPCASNDHRRRGRRVLRRATARPMCRQLERLPSKPHCRRTAAPQFCLRCLVPAPGRRRRRPQRAAAAGRRVAVGQFLDFLDRRARPAEPAIAAGAATAATAANAAAESTPAAHGGGGRHGARAAAARRRRERCALRDDRAQRRAVGRSGAADAASDLDGAAETLRQLCAESGTLGRAPPARGSPRRVRV